MDLALVDPTQGASVCCILALDIGKPEVACTLFEPDAYDIIFQQVRELSPHAITTTSLGDSHRTIHRGGYTVAWHWGEHSCRVADASSSEVSEPDAEVFGELVQLMRRTCGLGKHADCR